MIQAYVKGMDANSNKGKEKDMDAKHIKDIGRKELRFAAKASDTWPGYHRNNPLGESGYWIGDHQHHIFLGKTLEDASESLADMYPSILGIEC